MTVLYKQVGNTVVELTAEEVSALEVSTTQGTIYSNRNKRDALIAATDWWASSDLTMTDEQTAYRQALRDITAHEDWPELADSDWPTKP
jgi:prophage maintenance system killer protein|tara:strand:- start:53 stop:319 length:267 start_codon:yes stop_codon:yes gene_type:complete